MIRTITREGILKKQDYFLDGPFGTPAGDHFLFVEVGPSDAYDRLHIRNAIHLPSESIAKRAKHLLPDLGTEMILYSGDGQDRTVLQAARELAAIGYFNVSIYWGGKRDWKANGLWVQTALVPADGFT